MADFRSVEQNHPTNIVISRRRIQIDGSILLEVGAVARRILGAVIKTIHRSVGVCVVLADVTNSVSGQFQLVSVGIPGAVVFTVVDTITIEVYVTFVTNPVTICVRLCSVRNRSTVVNRVTNTITIPAKNNK